jgi:hypothetical protein
MKKPRLSFDDIGDLIRNALDEETKKTGKRSPYIEAVYEGYFIYSFAGETFKRTYTIVSEEKITLGKPEVVEEEYRNTLQNRAPGSLRDGRALKTRQRKRFSEC